MGGSQFCFFHDPKFADERKKARRRGAAVKHGLEATPLAMKAPEGLQTIAQLMELVEVVLRGCIEGDVESKLASAMSGLIKTQANLIVDFKLEDRIEALEEAAQPKEVDYETQIA